MEEIYDKDKSQARVKTGKMQGYGYVCVSTPLASHDERKRLTG